MTTTRLVLCCVALATSWHGIRGLATAEAPGAGEIAIAGAGGAVARPAPRGAPDGGARGAGPAERAWRREGSSGTARVRACGDWALAGRQAGMAAQVDDQLEALCIDLAGGSSSLTVAEHLADLGEALQRVARLDAAEALLSRSLAVRQLVAPRSLEVAAGLHALAVMAGQRGDLAAVERLERHALALAEAIAPDTLAVVPMLRKQGWVAATTGDLDRAQLLYQEAYEISERVAPGSAEVVDGLGDLASVALYRGDPATAVSLLQRAAEIQRRLDPAGADMAEVLGNLGLAQWRQGDLEAAEASLRQAHAMVERAAPGSAQSAASLHRLALLALSRGDLDAVEELGGRALAILERVAPGDERIPQILVLLGNVAMKRGELATAEGSHRRAIGILEQAAPRGRTMSAAVNNLGQVLFMRGELDEAERCFERALELDRSDPIAVAMTYQNLAGVAFDRRELGLAQERGQRALDLLEEIVPGSMPVAEALINLGYVSEAAGDLTVARGLFERSLRIREQVGAPSSGVAGCLGGIGRIAAVQGEQDEAERLLGRAAELMHRVGPGTAWEAEALGDQARLLRGVGRLEEAATVYARAADALEAQQGRLGGTERVRSVHRAGHADLYRDYLELLLEMGRPAEAFRVLERSRARGLSAMLAERELEFESEIPADLDQERRLLARELDELQAALVDLSPAAGADEVEPYLDQLRQVRRRQEEMTEEIRTRSPRLAMLQYPEPVDPDQVLRSLDPGTVLLEYSLGVERSHLFVLSAVPGIAAPFAALDLEAGERQVERAVRGLVQHLGTSQERSAPAIERWSRELYDTLVRPAEPWLEPAQRVLVCPDGALHTLPFAALRRVDGAAGQARYLVEWKPIHSVVSATVYGQLLGRRGRSAETGPRTLVAFGDPTYPAPGSRGAAAAADPDLLLLAARGVRLEPLPGSRQEVLDVAAVWGKAATTFLGPQATENQAKSLGLDVDVIHFACHGILDQSMPLSSAIALAVPESGSEAGENGLLQAWEVFEQLRIDADVVVLSACGTALGQDVRGEGMIGLTRAFQYAGARSVVASLWAVPDRSTAVLMRRMHAGLRRGTSTDEALRQAQVALLAGPVEEPSQGGGTEVVDASHPWAWSGFQVMGDWR